MSQAAPMQKATNKSQPLSKGAHAGLLLQRKCACGRAASSMAGECEACSKKRLQRKLSIGASNDPLEYEADRVADQVMAMSPASGVSNAPLRVQRATQQATADTSTAPPSVDRVITSTGRPLDSVVQQDMGQRFGYDFSNVRIHTDTKAVGSVKEVNAVAFTVGDHIAFDIGYYSPTTKVGQQLLAHELAHVVQQSHLPSFTLRRACRSAAQCSKSSTGSAPQFGARVEAESEAIAVASGGAPAAPGGHASCLLPRHGTRASNFETLATSAGLGATIAAGIDGFFINACLSPNDGANNSPCSEFPGGAPAGTNPNHNCVQLHTTDEDKAIALRAKPRPLGFSDLTQFLWITSTVAHESQHIRFDTNAGTIVPPAPDCNIITAVSVAGGAPVESLLSEISAEIGEFDVYFQNSINNPRRPSTIAMKSEEHDIASRGGENILGNIRDLQCACNCNTVDTFVVQVFNNASSGWSAAEKKEFNKAMTGFIPSFWPRSLHQR